MSRQFTKELKEYAVRYYAEHKDLGLTVCAKNLGTIRTTLFGWIKKSKSNSGEVLTRGSENYQSDEAMILRIYEEFVYLTSIMDIYSKKIIAWVLSTSLEAKLVVKIVNKAKAARGINRPLVMNSYRGHALLIALIMSAMIKGFACKVTDVDVA